ncbi:MAG: sugar phosphate isomerase/epimerase [Clostridia bacterium]|nr:sugar phosphate isomerase/epimerase [Clostridia bacterium]
MKLVTQTDNLNKRYGDEKAVRMLCEAGFDAIDYSMFCMDNDDDILNTPQYAAHAEKLRKIAEEYGVKFEQSHAPFPPFKVDDDAYSKKTMPRVERAIEISGILGVKACVVHPVAAGKDQYDINMRYFETLLPLAQKHGVKIALENMWGRDRETNKIIPNVCSLADDFNRYVDSLDPKYFTACLDIGHCGLVGSDAATMIREMGANRITCLHIHDNNGIDDNHTLPYTRNIKWDEVLKALGEIGYKGNFTYEADNFLKKFPDPLIETCLKFMVEVGRYMISEVQRYGAKK